MGVLAPVSAQRDTPLSPPSTSLDVELDTGWTLELGWLATAWGLARGGQLLFVLGGLIGHVAGDRHVHLCELRLAGSLVIVGLGVIRLAGGHVNVGLGDLRLAGSHVTVCLGGLRLPGGHSNVGFGNLRLAGSHVSVGLDDLRLAQALMADLAGLMSCEVFSEECGVVYMATLLLLHAGDWQQLLEPVLSGPLSHFLGGLVGPPVMSLVMDMSTLMTDSVSTV